MRRTGFKTRTSWSPAVPLLSGTGKTKSAPRRETGFSRTVKLQVRKRAGGGFVELACCEACGVELGRYGGEIQHRLSRGMGGSTDPVVTSCANAVLLCGHGAAPIRSGCHGACEDRLRHLSQDGEGFWIEHGNGPDYDPRYVAILLHGAGSGLPVWLAEDGRGIDGSGYLYVLPEMAA